MVTENRTSIDLAALRTALGEYFDSQAYWRQDVAERYPEDGRNRVAVEKLHATAAHVVDLPDDDEKLVRLARVVARTAELGAEEDVDADAFAELAYLHDGVYSAGLDANRIASRVGFEPFLGSAGVTYKVTAADVFAAFVNVEEQALRSYARRRSEEARYDDGSDS